MSETYTNGGGRSDYRLPTVNANDNGKVLKVVEGEWKKAEDSGGGGGGGGGLLLVDGTGATTDKTAGEIETAFLAGQTVLLDASSSAEGRTQHYLLISFSNDNGSYEANFASNYLFGNSADAGLSWGD